MLLDPARSHMITSWCSKTLKQMVLVLMVLCGIAWISTPCWAREFQVSCPKESPVLGNLAQRLERAETSQTWRQIYRETQETIKLLHTRLDTTKSQDQLKHSMITQLSCAHALALESGLYLSDHPLRGPLWAMRSVGHAVSLSSLNPKSLQSRHARQWLNLALKRVNKRWKSQRTRLKTSRPPLGRWRQIKISSQERPYQLQLILHDLTLWNAGCGLIKGCQEPPSWRVYTRRSKTLTFLIPASQYITQWSGPCANTQKVVDLSTQRGRELKPQPLTLKVPSLKCYSRMILTDQLTGDPINLDTQLEKELLILDDDEDLPPIEQVMNRGLPEGHAVKIKLAGYQPAQVKVPTLGTPIQLKLKRCSRQVSFKLTPNDARVTGPAQVYWGLPTQFKISRSGYIEIMRSINLERPQKCYTSPHQERIELSRDIEVITQTQEGLNIAIHDLTIGGIPQTQPHIMRPVGRYRIEAQVPGYQKLTSTLTVPECQTSSCTPLKLELTLLPPPPPPSSTATRLSWLGGGITIAGASLLSFAYQSQRYYDQTLNYTHDLSQARNRIKMLYGWGWGTLAGGLITTGIGLLWPELGGEPQNHRRGAVP